MKKIIRLVFCVLIIYFTIFSINRISCENEYIYGEDGVNVFAIKYNGATYIPFDYIHDWYNLINDDTASYRYNIINIKANDLGDLIPPFDYCVLYSEKYDDFSNFIIKNPTGYYMDNVYVKDDFVFPSLKLNEIDEVWMSNMASDKNNITDSDIVNIIVESAKSKGKIELDKEIVDYIQKYSWDNHCFYLKYKGYPLVEEFHIEETEDGRYVVDQFTAEEYDTIYYDEVAHK